MYINPFLAGVLAAIGVELLLFIAFIIYVNLKK